MIEKVWHYVEEQHMLSENDYVVAGVSGGADSVCLLYMLLELQKRIPFLIHVVHMNHMIREEAGEDAAYVEALCRQHELPFTLFCRDVEQEARKRKLSCEETGRQLRYEAFYQVIREQAQGRRGRIAIAHNKNDCCETFLFHLFRGSGLQGLGGIRPVREDIIRPILCLERIEIEAFLKEKEISYCIDKTNLEDNYTRNRIRHHILPVAEKGISQNTVAHISEACERIHEAYELIEDMTIQAYEACIRTDEKGIHILEKPFFALHKTIQGYCLREALARVAGSRRNLEAVHVQSLGELFGKQCGRQLDMPYEVIARREYEGICLVRKQEVQEEPFAEYRIRQEEESLLEAGETVFIALSEQEELAIALYRGSEWKNIPQKAYTKWFDYDKIKDSIVVRKRKKGDFLTINTANQTKSLKAYFIDQKVPKEDRDKVWLVAEESHVIWVIGERISSYYKVSEETEQVIEIKYIRRNKNG